MTNCVIVDTGASYVRREVSSISLPPLQVMGPADDMRVDDAEDAGQVNAANEAGLRK